VSAEAEFDGNSQWTTTAHFAEAPAGQTFDVKTAAPGTLGRYGIGLDVINAKNLSFSLLYRPEYGHGYNQQMGEARVSYRF
jgi:uncharacterized protein with beta-barrel porin domain